MAAGESFATWCPPDRERHTPHGRPRAVGFVDNDLVEPPRRENRDEHGGAVGGNLTLVTERGREVQSLHDLPRIRLDDRQRPISHPTDVRVLSAVKGDDVWLRAGGQREPIQQLTTRKLED